jgi:hypothetical protein
MRCAENEHVDGNTAALRDLEKRNALERWIRRHLAQESIEQ